MTHMNLILIYHGTHESPGNSDSRPGHQDLCPLTHKPLRFETELCNAAT